MMNSEEIHQLQILNASSKDIIVCPAKTHVLRYLMDAETGTSACATIELGVDARLSSSMV